MKQIAESFIRPIIDSHSVTVDVEELKPITPYPFPWPFGQFIDQFPEAVSLVAPALHPFQFDQSKKYDLIILAYTVWFLSPSPPITAFLKSGEGKTVLNGTPVITLIACRNMWLEAQEQVKQLIGQANAHVLDNVVLTDRGSFLKTLVTTPRWMLTGKRNAFLGIFPRAGIHNNEIVATQRFGKALLFSLLYGDMQKREPVLTGLKAATVDQRLIGSEKIARRSFLIWGKLFRTLGPQGHLLRKLAAIAYGLFLIVVIATVVPLTMIIRVLLRPWRKQAIEKELQYFEGPSGSNDDRMEEFS
ncbi:MULTISPECIES: dialkylrecorsinol condensing enzyme [Pseudomonas]|uniref:Dialkylresorcinol condensing enzyme n=1 Tax=Pseudomonas aphyarum TaxID=2942629 RepID=A0ABT5PGI5_9PSED|nr:dialkylrecorsinol condensing enzyme [Pseudomonas aphyarum]MDD0970175.1 dialkylresorcinol condensing enzyme [Pseudomonas aphyarum]MDD1122992.1 dialkylresorcinol condensing enzyme [Pseudomonas aphyarum]